MKKLVKKHLNQKGFTLIELVVVVAILGILAVIAIPRFAQIRADSQAESNRSNALSVVNAAEVMYQDTGAGPAGADSAAMIADLVSKGYIRSAPPTAAGCVLSSPSTGKYQCAYDIPDGATDGKFTSPVG